MTTNRCLTCNGACCKIFILKHTRGDLVKWAFGRGYLKEFKTSLFEIVKELIFLRPIQKQVVKSNTHDCMPWEKFYSCRALWKGRCLIYRFRMVFCPKYVCTGERQLANFIPIDGKPVLPILHPMEHKDGEGFDTRMQDSGGTFRLPRVDGDSVRGVCKNLAP